MRIRVLIITLLMTAALAVSTAGCSSSLTTPTAPQPTSTPIIDIPDIATPTLGLAPPSIVTPDEPPNFQPGVNEIPEKLLEEILANLVERTDADSEDIQVVKVESVTWNDGSLGCAKPGELYIQILIKGFRVVLQVEGEEYDYRASDSGDFKLCE